jgi:hypothetical protein
VVVIVVVGVVAIQLLISFITFQQKCDWLTLLVDSPHQMFIILNLVIVIIITLWSSRFSIRYAQTSALGYDCPC